MSRGHRLLALAAVVATPGLAEAYNPIEVHPWIARQAVAHLVATYGDKYREAYTYVDAIARGAHHEDDVFLDGDTDPKTVRLMRHFYRPTDGVGLTYADRTFINSFQWGGAVNEQNLWGWDDAFAYYAAGDLEEAYFALGHIVHLLSDLTVPAHVHLDQHGPPDGDDYESYCTSMTQSEHESMLPVPARGAEVLEADDLEALWQAVALASYWRNMYPGTLDREAGPSGALVEMFGDGVKFSEFKQSWTIDGVGTLDKAFFEHQPGHFYFKQLDATPALDRANFDPVAAQQFELGPTDRAMAARVADDMIPLAILASASAIKMFIDADPQVDPQTDPEASDDGEGTETAGCSASSRPGQDGLGLLLVISLFLAARQGIRSCAR